MNVFDPNTHIKTVTVVGVGGTGAQVACILGRADHDMQRNRRHTPQIVLIDPDTVEEKNIGRQLFSPSVLGIPKAKVVGQMLNMALGLDVRRMWMVLIQSSTSTATAVTWLCPA
ncbi:ThiF family adenylyltransferase [Phototrophicus methaneseepsis]|uniref:ThiF family adenylyltransferase n=1 Tax=Phototrophicus methaneseepsis TaxID=2710758 RepID=A0A7S8EBA7_9CHLR|nr:ThiF family adenylyltransferase [Phototrophicus methaneseepsis]QPC83704.1 ThiF family adenylyltransferase [Phototrophicus methaneseepsis]